MARHSVNLCATDFSISSGGPSDVRRHPESVRPARLGPTKGGMVQYVAHGQNEVDCTYSSVLVFRVILATRVGTYLIF